MHNKEKTTLDDTITIQYLKDKKMSGQISSLGIGSGVLTADVIDQLRNADESNIIKPIDRNIERHQQKKEASDLLSSLFTTFDANASALNSETLFSNYKVSTVGDAEISLDPGARVDSFTLKTEELALRDVTKFGSFEDRSSTGVAVGSGTLKIGGVEVAYDSSMKLEDLAQAITDAGGSKFSASILKTSEGAFSLIVTSKESGAKNALEIEDVTGGLNSKLLDPNEGYEKVQAARDATFVYNGITMTRSSNTITDISVGLNITLKKEGDTTNAEINLDTDKIKGEMEAFVESFNALMTNLNDLTTVDMEKGQEGVFVNDNFIKSIARELTRSVTQQFNGESLVNYGIDVDREGRMSFKEADLEKALTQDPNRVRDFFAGGYDEDFNRVNGIFGEIDDKIKSYTGQGKMFQNFEEALDQEGKNLAQSRVSAMESLNTRFATMASRFAAYDSMISQMNNQFSSLQMMIANQMGNN